MSQLICKVDHIQGTCFLVLGYMQLTIRETWTSMNDSSTSGYFLSVKVFTSSRLSSSTETFVETTLPEIKYKYDLTFRLL